MKSIRVHQFGEPKVLQLEEVPTPQPNADQILVRVEAVGVNPVETYIRSGAYAVLPTLPYTPGKDAAGVIESLGANVKSARVGDRVYISGTSTGAYAEFALCEVNDVHALPEKISFAQGAAINTPYATAYRALFQRAKAVAGETVLVHGASGGVGTAAVQFARAAGLTVFATGGTERGRELVLKNGAHHVFDHRAPDYLEKAVAQTKKGGFDIILEMLANVNLGKDLPALAKSGRVVVIGSRGKVEINPRDVMSRDAAILGMVLSNATKDETSAIYRSIDAGLENGSLRPVVGKEFPLAQAAQAHQAVLEPGASGKIVLVP
ncbi:MAG: NADPH:quinone reductase [Verrucomicrobiota bacterium]